MITSRLLWLLKNKKPGKVGWQNGGVCCRSDIKSMLLYRRAAMLMLTKQDGCFLICVPFCDHSSFCNLTVLLPHLSFMCIVRNVQLAQQDITYLSPCELASDFISCGSCKSCCAIHPKIS